MLTKFIQFVYFSICLAKTSQMDYREKLLNPNAELRSSAEFTETDCNADVQLQPSCRAYLEVFTWNNWEKRCVKAVYGGCNATPNNFETWEECRSTAREVCANAKPSGYSNPADFIVEDCNKPHQLDGSCRAYIKVFTWNNMAQKCVPVVFGGCNGTPNMFRTLKQCESTAQRICKAATFSQKDCNKDVEKRAPCRGNFVAFTWNDGKKRCVKVSYGGCKRTLNNFETLSECENTARPICKAYNIRFAEDFFEEACNHEVHLGDPPCTGNYEVWKWSNVMRACIPEIYHGCYGSANRFDTLEGCNRIAEPVCRLSTIPIDN